MDKPIRCVEGFDIAHLQGNETVASKVCFIDGRPFKQEYRRFRIKSFSNLSHGRANDDYASMREVISRRYREAGDGHELYPDVILIDGGLGQLHAAMDAFEQLDVQPPMVVSLAKKEELIYVQGSTEPIKLGRNNPRLAIAPTGARRIAQVCATLSPYFEAEEDTGGRIVKPVAQASRLCLPFDLVRTQARRLCHQSNVDHGPCSRINSGTGNWHPRQTESLISINPSNSSLLSSRTSPSQNATDVPSGLSETFSWSIGS